MGMVSLRFNNWDGTQLLSTTKGGERDQEEERVKEREKKKVKKEKKTSSLSQSRNNLQKNFSYLR